MTSNRHRIAIESSKSGSKPSVFDTFDFQMCFSPQRRVLFRHRIGIESSKRGPNPKCLVHFDFDMCFAPQWRALFPHLNSQKCSENGVCCTCLLQNMLRSTTACTFSTSQLPKAVRTGRALFASKCPSRHNGTRFFNISTSKSCPNLRCFDTFYFKTCFGPQQRALFKHLNFQKSETEVL